MVFLICVVVLDLLTKLSSTVRSRMAVAGLVPFRFVTLGVDLRIGLNTSGPSWSGLRPLSVVSLTFL